MSVKREVERLKKMYEDLKNDDEAKAILNEAKGLVELLLKGKAKDIDAKLTGFADVDETIALAHKGEKMRKAYASRVKAIHLLGGMLNIASRHIPVVGEAVKKVRKTIKAAKSLKRRKKS